MKLNKLFKILSVMICAAFVCAAFSGCDIFAVSAELDTIEISVYGYDSGAGEITVTSDNGRSLDVNVSIAWQDTANSNKKLNVVWEFVGDDLGCKVVVIDPGCTKGTLAMIDLGDKTGTVILRATAKSKNEISADLTIRIKQSLGDFYDLREAYNYGWLTKDNLSGIAYYYNNRFNNVTYPELLSDETQLKIKQNYLENYYPELLIDFSAYLDYYDLENPVDGVRITAYYGTYSDYVVLSIWDDFVCYDRPETFDVTIGGAVFEDFWAREIYVWTEQKPPITGELWQPVSWYGQSSASIENGFNIFQLATSQQEYSYNWYVGYYDGWAYVYQDGEIVRMRPDGSDVQPLNIPYFSQAMIHDGWLYYTEGSFNMYTGMSVDALKRVRLDGTGHSTYDNTAELVTIRTGGLEGAPDPYTVHAGVCDFKGYGDWIYYTAGASRWDVTLYKININGTGKTKIAKNCTDFMIENGFLIVSSEIGRSQFHTKITRYDLNGGSAKILIENTGTAFHPILAYDGYLYYRAYTGSPSVCRMKLDGSDAKTIAANASFCALLNDKIYYTDSVLKDGSTWDRQNRLFCIDTDGISSGVLLHSDISVACITGDSVFFETSEYPPLNSGKKVTRRLWRLSLANGSVTEVYNNGGTENYWSFFIHENEIYIVLR